MTKQELLNRVIAGHFILVGEFRNARLESEVVLDRTSGETLQQPKIVYAVECGDTFGSVLIYRNLKDINDVNAVNIHLTKGRNYAFELDRLTRRGGSTTAQLGFLEPQLIE